VNRSRIVVAAASTALIGLVIGYGVGVAFDRSPDAPVDPIELDGPLPSATTGVSVAVTATTAALPAVVPPPTLGPTTLAAATTTRPLSTAPPPPTMIPTTALPPSPLPVADDDDVAERPVDAAVEPERDEGVLADSESDEDDAEMSDDRSDG
jgi:hypothetical protein